MIHLNRAETLSNTVMLTALYTVVNNVITYYVRQDIYDILKKGNFTCAEDIDLHPYVKGTTHTSSLETAIIIVNGSDEQVKILRKVY